MITEQDLQEAIAECKGKRNPDASTCIKLAAYYTIQREMYGTAPETPMYSFAADPPKLQIGDYGRSDFLQAVKDKDPATVWPVIDELMDTLKMVNERVYNSVMRKINK